MAAKFGTSGLRGLVGDLTDGTAAAHARAFGRHLLENRIIPAGAPVYLGRDMRASSPQIAAQCASALIAEGLEPVECSVLPTPALALHAMGHGAAALMITGSHIPDDRNGVKFYRPDGEIDKQDEAGISRLAPECEAAALTGPHVLRDDSAIAASAFIARYRGFAPDGLFGGLRIGLYEHSSAASDTMAAILEEAGAEVVRLGKSKVFVPVDTEAVSEDTRTLVEEWVRSHTLDGLVSTDGDGDRPLVVDETGAVIRGDALGLIVARYLRADAVVTPVTSNSGIESRCEAEVRRTKVGSPFVIAGMAEALSQGKERVIGFEANGGVLTGNIIETGSCRLAALPTRDSVLPILCAFAAARSAGESLSAHVAGLGLPVAASDRIENFPTATSQALVADLSADSAARTRFFETIGRPVAVDLTDGLRVTLDDGCMVHLRPSGNAPEMRIYSEAENEELAWDLIMRTAERVRQSAGAYPG
ncbi:MAG: phosphomannomutase [Hoeflea sp.]|uniref:phosphomannomutase n=1 Tax=Hoeflea sp. TaxID=1940281 RepID=UPI001D2DBF5D|nr:phosphomannomutase [Hoeflea sp.]MBU4531612.1 phosphomannomutase [Alphaproteobacteria bacterium]MBU4544469.1 phosphomannomutase [Alphaproteobacteria bacterium]MBU4552700.1 phosphomannomutase [Alphaproteobacteria bacterium]MBV1724888.1 phosphomannomutase [Hoeflea sp.]MBV1760908.1 phosphomannomutase [Hoeflea sp.]